MWLDFFHLFTLQCCFSNTHCSLAEMHMYLYHVVSFNQSVAFFSKMMMKLTISKQKQQFFYIKLLNN